MKMDEIYLKYPLLNEKILRLELGKVANSPNHEQKMKKITDRRKVQRDQFIEQYKAMPQKKFEKLNREIKEIYEKLQTQQNQEVQLHNDAIQRDSHVKHDLDIQRGGLSHDHDFSQISNSKPVLGIPIQRVAPNERYTHFHDPGISEIGQENLFEETYQQNLLRATQQDHFHAQMEHDHKHEHDVQRLHQKIQYFRDMEDQIKELRKQKKKIDAKLEHLNSEYMDSKNSAVKAREELLKLNPKSPIPKIDTDIKDHFHDFFGGWLLGRRPGFSSSNFQEFRNYSDIHDFQDFQGLGRRIW